MIESSELKSEIKDANAEKTQPLIIFHQLTKKFGNFTAVNSLDLEIYSKEILGFLGPNGAGKSTTIKMLAGLLKPTEGTVSVRVNDQIIDLEESTKDIILDHLGFLIEHPTFYESQTPRQLLAYFAKLRGYPRAKVHDRIEEVMRLMNLIEWIDKPIKTFSSGMQQKLGIASAIIHDPEIIVLDEPQTGLDPKARKELRDLLINLRDQGKTIFLSSHILYELSELADRFAIINHGQLIACDTIEALQSRAQQGSIKIETIYPFTSEAASNVISQLLPRVFPLTGLEQKGSQLPRIMRFLPDAQQFEIDFDGDKANQNAILKQLIADDFPVVDYSVPKSGVLEQIFLSLVEQSDESQIQNTKKAVEVKGLL